MGPEDVGEGRGGEDPAGDPEGGGPADPPFENPRRRHRGEGEEQGVGHRGAAGGGEAEERSDPERVGGRLGVGESEPAVGEKRQQDWSTKERLQFLAEAEGLEEQALGELLRRRGVHREQLDAWRLAVEEAFAQPRAGRRSPEAKRIKELEREVARKDKALAETAALLVLQKKLQLLFPDGQADEDDDTDDGSDR